MLDSAKPRRDGYKGGKIAGSKHRDGESQLDKSNDSVSDTKAQQTPQTERKAADSLPSVALPEGGGAIRGIGEKFSVNAATGTAGMLIPLPVSQGRAGAAPDLRLSYDSGAGNGVFGFGWNLSAPAITRKTDKGLPRYADGEESDVYILSGAEDLVPVLDSGGARKFLERTVHKTDYRIFFYRPRIEGLFARIERWVAKDTGLTHWRSLSRDNVTTLYGFDTHSQIASSEDATKIFSWRICRSFDDKGNLALYTYSAEDGAGLSMAQAHEANRTPKVRGAQAYLKSIQYGNIEPYFPDWTADAETPLPTQWMFSVVFDYGDHTASPPTPDKDAAWLVRPDPFSSYRAGFELRTYRRVQRVLFFNNFPQETTAGANLLVRSLDCLYSDQRTPSDARNPIYTFLASVTVTGYPRNGGSSVFRSLPALDFNYSQPQIQQSILTLDRESLDNLPEGIDGTRFRWVDLDGEGLSGILSETSGGWFYKRNLSANNIAQLSGGASALPRAKFGPSEQVRAIPTASNLSSGLRLLDLSGGGQLDVVDLAAPDSGFFRRTTDEDFEPFHRFQHLPQLDWSDPNLKFIDVTGDGLADILLTDTGLFTYYSSLGEAGFDLGGYVCPPWDEEKGPQIVFADGTDTIFIADMSGDGLNDIVRVRNGETCYWPNIGYGRFGPKVTMDGAPRFDNEERYDPHRIRLADIDGSGAADLLYVGGDGVRAWFNQSGNSWSAPTLIAVFPTADRLSDVQAFDLLGSGTACLVWSSPLPSEAAAPLHYVDLMGGQKPHLLISVRNNLGAETRVAYAPSTKFYLDAKEKGRPWITKLAFPVQVVERVETIDWIGLNRFVTRYAYHHGFFDGYEREFRGFGLVERWDTEEFREDAKFNDGEFANWDQQSWSPPIHTKTWFHTGAFVEALSVSQQYRNEYWVEPGLSAEDAAVNGVPDSVLPTGLSGFELREAYRGLKGRALRVEVYSETKAPDGAMVVADPYTITAQNFSVVCLQRMGPNLHAVFRVDARDTLTFNYERQADDPRVTHDLILESDSFGNVVRGASIGYPRRNPHAAPEPTLSPAMQAMLDYDQTRLHVRGTQNQYTAAFGDLDHWPEAGDTRLNQWWDNCRAPLPSATDVAELTGIPPSPKGTGVITRYAFDEMDGRWQAAWGPASDIPYESIPAPDVDGAGALPTTPTRRFIAQSRTLYRADDLSGLLPLGQMEPRALPGESYAKALTLTQLDAIFGALVTPNILSEGGYVPFAVETGWWSPSGRVFYSPGDQDAPAQELAFALAHFVQLRRAVDPFKAITRVDYDAYDLLPIAATDPVGNVTGASNDYRVLAPNIVTDPNGNRGAVAFDALGLVTATAVQGKSDAVGDLLTGFTTDLDEATIVSQFADPLANPVSLLGDATTRVVYDLNAYIRTSASGQPSPACVYTLARETHVSDLGVGGNSAATKFQHHFVYSDGFGREIQRKARVAAGPITDGGASVSPRWVGSGWTIFNNKGKPVRRYEPFFSATNSFEFAAKIGVSAVLFYDPPGRIVVTLHPDNSWEKVVFDAWRQETWDGNDTVLISDPTKDADVGEYFSRYLISTLRILSGEAEGFGESIPKFDGNFHAVWALPGHG